MEPKCKYKKIWFYTLDEDRIWKSSRELPGNKKDFENDWFKISDGILTTKKGYSFDGATLSPDFYFAVKGATFHDPIYQFARELAEHWGCSIREVICWGDKIFLDVCKHYSKGFKILPRIFFSVVYVGGYPFWKVKRFFEKFKFKRRGK